MKPAMERFWENVAKEDGREDFCWLWLGSHLRGYGVFRVDGRTMLAHRFAYAALRGPIPAGMELDHLCRMPLCVNPAHLEPVTPTENKQRVGTRTHCRLGHAYPAGPGRRCIECKLTYTRLWRAKRTWNNATRIYGRKP